MEALLHTINKNDDVDNKRALEYIVQTMDEDDKQELLSEICQMIYDSDGGNKRIQNLLTPFDPTGNMDKIIIYICRNYLASRETTKYLVKECNTLSDIIYMLVLLFTEKKDSSYQLVAENLLFCYDYELTNKDVEYLEDRLTSEFSVNTDEEIDNIYSYLKSKRKFDKEDYKPPSWVSVQEGENISLLATVPTGFDEDTGEEVKFDEIIESANSFFFQMLPRKDRYDEDRSIFSINDLPENIRESMKTFLKASSGSKSKGYGMSERVWGPKNSFEVRECMSGPEGNGPCRMLLCHCLLPEGETWFNGKCDVCQNFIMDRSHALRFPSAGGGWEGCYCSFECMTENGMRTLTKEENILIGIIKENIERFGIMDRSSFC